MIKMIVNLFKEPEKIDESTVEVAIEVPEKTKTRLFDEAVREVVSGKLKKRLKKEFINRCYSLEAREQTLRAANEHKETDYDSVAFRKILVKYPKAIVYRRYDKNVFDLTFNLDLLIQRLLDKELEHE